MAGVAVVTDSTASLTRQQAMHAGVLIIPLQVVIDGDSRAESEEGGTAAAVADALRQGKSVTTSRPTPDAFAAAFAELAATGVESIVSVRLSRRMSGTYEAAALAAESAPVPVIVVDSTTVAMAMGFAVLSAAGRAQVGAGGAEVADVARRRAAAATTFFSVDSLEYLRRGGRIGPAAALLGSALAVKPLLTITRGEIRPHERVRTASKALVRLEELGLAALARAAGTTDHVDVAVLHVDHLSGAQALAERLRGRLATGGDITISEVSAVLGAHVGPGTLGIAVSPRP
ncbi:MAG: DegV family protein [Propionibacteriaceae bacterium]